MNPDLELAVQVETIRIKCKFTIKRIVLVSNNMIFLCQVKIVKSINIGNKLLGIKKGDITRERTDAIVNAANNYLQHGGGIARVIANSAGPELEKESKLIGYIPTGSAAITTGGNLSTKYVIHAVGPIWKGGLSGEDDQLSSCVSVSLKLAEKQGMNTIAFPAISTGIFGFPLKRASKILLSTAYDFLKSWAKQLSEIWFVLFSQEDYQQFSDILNELNVN